MLSASRDFQLKKCNLRVFEFEICDLKPSPKMCARLETFISVCLMHASSFMFAFVSFTLLGRPLFSPTDLYASERPRSPIADLRTHGHRALDGIIKENFRLSFSDTNGLRITCESSKTKEIRRTEETLPFFVTQSATKLEHH